MKRKNSFRSALLGLVVGDALGVPFEFRSREEMQASPAAGMQGYGTHCQPPGTWSDDSSLTFCLADSLCTYGYTLKNIAKRFVLWKNEAYWTAHNEVFDIGIATAKSIDLLNSLLKAEEYEGLEKLKEQSHEYENGNGSLMRIMPLLFEIEGKALDEQWQMVWDVSALTHKHIRAAMACFIYLKLAEYLLAGIKKDEAYSKTQALILDFWEQSAFPEEEQAHFRRIIQEDIRNCPEGELHSSGYVIHSLELSFYCLLGYEDYASALLFAINRGEDTDTSAAITGALMGLYYGQEAIPKAWLEQLVGLKDIQRLCWRFERAYALL